MDLLEQPLEAVAFRLYSLPEAAEPAAAAAWTCLAAFVAAAAAAGLWRLRHATHPADVAGGASKSDALDLVERPSSSQGGSPEPARSSSSSERLPPPEPAPSPKERYTAYYYVDSGCVGCCGVDDDADEAEEQDDEEEYGAYGLTESPEQALEWAAAPVRSLSLSPTAAETARYRRDSSALGGSIVRLWDHGSATAAAAASPRRRGRTAGVVSSSSF